MSKTEKRKAQLKISNKRYTDSVKHTEWYKERMRRYSATYKNKNREKIREIDKLKKRISYPERKEDNKRWRLNNPEKRKEYYEKYKNSGATEDSRIKSRYGITRQEYNEILQSQENNCGLCGDPFDANVKRKNKCIDHCHKTNKVRGIIHFGCNILLGFAEDKPTILKKAIEYLKRK